MTIADGPVAAPPMFQLRCAVAYAAPTSVNGILLPYLPVWLHSLDFSPLEIGTILAAQMILRIIAAPIAGLLAGLLREPSHILILSALLSLTSLAGLLASRDFWSVLVVAGIQAAAFAPFNPVVEAIAVTGIRRWGFQYGFMRVWGSIGFVISTLFAGTSISFAGPAVIPYLVAGVLVLAVVAGAAAPKLGATVKPRRRLGWTKGLHARQRHLHLLLIGASLIQSSHGLFYGFSTIQWQDMGFSSSAIAFLWVIGVIAEIGVFFASGHLARRLSPWTLMGIGCVAAILRWSLFPFGANLWTYAVLQVGHAFSFAFVHLGLQHRLVETVEEERQATVQGAYAFYNGAFLAGATVLSGVIYRQAGLYGYFAMALLALCGLAALAVAVRLQPQKSAAGG